MCKLFSILVFSVDILMSSAPIVHQHYCAPPKQCTKIPNCLDKFHGLQTIKQSFCGFGGTALKICCSAVDNPTSTTPKPLTNPINWDNELVGHKNFKLLSVDKCGMVSSRLRITSGANSSPGEFPWMALIAVQLMICSDVGRVRLFITCTRTSSEQSVCEVEDENMSSRLQLVCVLVFVFVFFVDAQWAIEDDGCRTPDRGVGTCIIINDCKPIMDLLDAASQQSQPLPPNIRNLLRSYQCGYSGKTPKVCCPSKPISVPGLISTKNTGIPLPPDVSKHRNLNLLPEKCGHVDTGDRIINGNSTGLFEFPWMAILSYRTSRGPDFKCGATILNSRYILTAAHCISNLRNPLIGVRVGDHNIKTSVDCEITEEGEEICAPPFRDLAIEEIIPHPDYNTKTFSNDIGLLRVSLIDLNQENTRPVCLPLDKARNYNFTNKSCVVTGWGITETGRSSPSLLKAQIPLVSLEECISIYKKQNQTAITYRHLCAGGKTRSDSCAGDSGGPLHVIANLHRDVRLVQQGLVSFGPRNCGASGYPGVYTRIAYYMDWILDNLKP